MNTVKSTAKEATEKKARKLRKEFSSEERCQAVLSIWSERRKPAQVCREMDINWTILNQWQKRALEAMLKSLEPRKSAEKSLKPALSTKLEKLLAKESRRVLQVGRMEKRLEEIQESAKKK